ncbi:nucleolar protein 56 [Halogranum gelatinilyticum]|uniref:Nucleolar protein 56 n=1 Tax=Halogranum gelatinilyticum TaxID=660521 RepID=A0A1G9WF15_9EURY|nr:NOP5/NOP56 family protein [Halogranum gelatinilyticum]SDM82843.1 nucleolar protein 56 [Halogranum gelatinilyticum]
MTTDAWFADLASGDTDEAVARIREGRADAPADWPAAAVESGFAADEEAYYVALREATITAARTAVAERERADDKQLLHAVRAMDDAERTANELAERLSEWAGTLFDDAGSGVGYARQLAERDPETPAEQPVISFAGRVADLADEADELREFIERRAPDVAPNLAEMAGPVLATRLISLAGGLDALAKKPSGTVQVLGAEDALFAHLAGRGTSPKHGVIFTHEYVRGTRPEDRGSAARAFAGKLTLAARVDHYGGEFKQELHDDLDERIETIQARAEGGDDE